MLRRRKARERTEASATPALDLTSLEPGWRAAVEETIASRARLEALVATCAPGPLRDRLAHITDRVDAGVQAAAEIAFRAQAASRTVASLDLDTVTAKLKDARRRLDALPQDAPGRPTAEFEVQALADQHAALSSLANDVDGAQERLRLLDLRLDAAVARAAQLVLRPDALDAIGGIEADLDGVVGELNALRAGFDDLGAAG